MARENRFKKAKALDEAAKSIVSSKPILKDFKESSLNKKTIYSNNNLEDKKNTLEDKHTSTSNKKIIIPNNKKIKMTKLGTSIRIDLKTKLDKESKKHSRTTNNLVNIIFDNLYNEETKSFDINLDKKESFKITSYHIKEEHFKAIEKICKSTGYNKSEIFNFLIEEGLKRI